MSRYLYPLVLILVGIGIGWIANERMSKQQAGTPTVGTPIRLAGYDLISPLLVCDSSFTGNSPALISLQKEVEGVVDKEKQAGNITRASVYFRDLRTGSELSLNGNDKFFPASLKKLPLMMQYYREAESNPSLLTTKKLLTGTTDYNAGTVLPPKEAPQYGKEYTAQELIDYMIKYSDNIGFEILYPSLGKDKFDQVYRQLQLHYPNSYTSTDDTGDYATPHQFSLFFRALYNATYLNESDSERALELLSQADFKDGLVAGVPAGTTVAHKFGVSAVNQPDGSQQGELHDCGIVYDKKSPYILCVMTKSTAAISGAEKAIADISGATYKYADNGYR